MRVKIRNKIYDPHEEPIMLIFKNEEDRDSILGDLSEMAPDATKYCIFNNKIISKKDIKKFMKTE